MRARSLGVWVAAAVAGIAFACSEGEIRKDADEAAKVVRDNPENAARVYDETYEKERQKGEGRIEASGDAYDSVLEVPKERADDQ